MSAQETDVIGDQRGRMLAYCDQASLGVAAVATAERVRTGIVLRGTSSLRTLPALPGAGSDRYMVSDVGFWAKHRATPRRPMLIPTGDALFEITLQDWTQGIAAQGFDDVLTPSLLVDVGDHASLRALLREGSRAEHAAAITLVACEAGALDVDHFDGFTETLGEHAHGQRLAFVFADSSRPLAKRGRMANLRRLRAMHPAAMMLGLDIPTGLDVAAHDGVAAIGVTGGLRSPLSPSERSGGGFAAGFMPGAFNTHLYETRSPSLYRDWYDNSVSPVCELCGGRPLDSFTPSPQDKDQILIHNIHCWLEIGDELRRRRPSSARDWLMLRRQQALAAHMALRPRASIDADTSLRWLCELDDPQGRRTTAAGSWI